MQNFIGTSTGPSGHFGTADVSASPSANALSRIAPEMGTLSIADVNGVTSNLVSVGKVSGRSSLFYERHGKRALDILIVLASMPVTLSIIALAALALWFESGFPFYRQKRLGQNGRSFWIFKLRTMCRHAEERLEKILLVDAELNAEWQTTQKLKVDPRITPIGNFLRRSSIDELPQILNVLMGDMSLVGPRPMLPDQLKLYGDPRAYFALLPGISGFWQISERNESLFVQRTDADWAYLNEMSFGSDLRVLWRTSIVVLRRTGY